MSGVSPKKNIEFMEGRATPVLRQIEAEMREASAQLDFETAAEKRDDLQALRTVLEKNTMVLGDGTDADIFALVSDELDAAVHVFHVRGGRIRGTRGWVISRDDDADESELMSRLFEQIFSEIPEDSGTGARAIEQAQAVSVDDVVHTPTRAVPREILVSVMPDDRETLAQWLAGKRGGIVDIHVPQRGNKAQLMETVKENAKQALVLHKTRRSGDLAQRGQAMDELAQYLDLPAAPLRIECYDISHTQGQQQVGSMVVFEDGTPRKDAYRHFNIHGDDGNGTPDDTSAMDEVLRRRFRRLLAEENGEDGEDDEGIAFESGPVDASGRPRRFSYRPDLVVVDGGLPQVNAARSALDAMGIDIPLIGLAKRLEEVWIPGEDFPVIFPRTSAALYMLQYVRDESHRFAITAHRKRRAKTQQRSVLDEIPGVGPSRQKALLRRFGSVKKIREATVGAIAEVPGIGDTLAQTIFDALNPTQKTD